MSTLYVNNIEPVSGSELTLISASLVTADNLTISSLTSSFEGDLQGTASYATQALSASYAVSASVEIIKEVSSSHANFADAALSSSYAVTSSFSTTALIKYDGPTYDIDAVACLTQAQYDAITPDNTTLYFIV